MNSSSLSKASLPPLYIILALAGHECSIPNVLSHLQGESDYFHLGYGTDAHVCEQQLVKTLKGKKISLVSVGALHCLAVTDTRQVYALGDNDHSQQGSGTTSVNRKPALVQGLDGYKITRVSCGSSHSLAWCTTDTASTVTLEPVHFFMTKDPLRAGHMGTQWSGRYIANKTCQYRPMMF